MNRIEKTEETVRALYGQEASPRTLNALACINEVLPEQR